MAEENQAAETDPPEGDDGSEVAPSAASSEQTDERPEPSGDVDASGEEEGAEAPPEEPPEDPIESLAGVKAVRAFLGDEVEEVTSFTGKPDEVAMTVPAGRIRALCDHLKTEHGFKSLSALCGVH